MALRLSSGLVNYITEHGGLKQALQNGKLLIYSGAQPTTADDAPTGTLLCTITDASGAHTAEVLATGSVTLDTGASGSVDSITVDSVELLDAAVNFNTSLSQTATDVAAAINEAQTDPGYTASAAGAVITITATRGAGADANGLVVTSGATTITTTDANMASGVNPANGLKYGVAAGGVLSKLSGQTWTGVAGATGTAGWFRLVGSVVDSGAADSNETEIRLDGAIATSGAEINMSSTSITSASTQTLTAFSITMPKT